MTEKYELITPRQFSERTNIEIHSVYRLIATKKVTYTARKRGRTKRYLIHFDPVQWAIPDNPEVVTSKTLKRGWRVKALLRSAISIMNEIERDEVVLARSTYRKKSKA